MFINILYIAKTSARLIIPSFISLLFITSSISAWAQGSKPPALSGGLSKSEKPEFKNQGEQEDYEIKTLFERDYKVQRYRKYKGLIISNDNTYKYGGSIIMIEPNPILRAIFDKGIFYPDVIAKALKYQPTLKINRDSLKAWLKKDTSKRKKKDLNFKPKMDSLRIFYFEEVKFLEKSPTQKRFRFWMFREGLLNPTTYFLELTNKKATEGTDILPFIAGAKLTFLKEGWLII